MMKKLLIFLLMLSLFFASCTSNQRAKNFGGTTNIELSPGETFVNATWKDNNLWIITYDSTNHTYYMHEQSS